MWPVSGAPRAAPVCRSHIRTVPSSPPLTATGVPSTSPTATALTAPAVAASGTPRAAPVRRSQTRTVPS